jgi:hypothetical protein
MIDGRGERIRTAELSVPNQRSQQKRKYLPFQGLQPPQTIWGFRIPPVRYGPLGVVLLGILVTLLGILVTTDHQKRQMDCWGFHFYRSYSGYK